MGLIDKGMESKGSRLEAYQFKRKDFTFDRDGYINSDGTVNREKLIKDSRRVAKATNQRLLRLEKEGMQKAPAYIGASKAVSGYYTKDPVNWGHLAGGKPRYKENTKNLTNDELFEMLKALGHTQQAVTSTPKAVKRLRDIGLNNIKDISARNQYKNLSFDDILDFFQTKALREMTKLYGYNAMLQAVDDAKGKHGENAYDKMVEAFSNTDNLAEMLRYLGTDNPDIGDAWIDFD